jgi:glucose-6-phosphate dehydrogenase assembly protein OpcA
VEATVTQLQVFGSGQPHPVDARAIEEELTRLWQAAAEAAGAEGEPGVAQVRLVNLVAYADGRAAAERAAAVMAELPARHPCRGIVVEAEPEGPSRPLEARVTAYCQLAPEGGKQLCCESITIAASGQAVEQVPGAVLPLLAPDLPYFLWWLGDPPFERQPFEELAEIADRIVLDSTEFRTPYATLARLVDVSRDHYRRPAFSDLNWARLKPWREMVAQFFDTPSQRPRLDRIESVIIDHGVSEQGASNPTQALLAAAWLATRLGWALDSCRSENGELLIEMRRQGSPLRVRIRPSAARGQAADELVSLRLEVGGPEPAAFAVTRTEDGLCGETTVELTGSQPQRRVARMEPLSDTQLVGDELSIPGRDPIYEDALRLAAELARSLEPAQR